MWTKIIHLPFLNVNGLALFPFILVKEKHFKNDPILINHEKIHLKQQLELLIFPFYILYFLNYVINLIKYKKHYTAYKNIVFEKEAYLMEHKSAYVKHRKIWSWIKFL